MTLAADIASDWEDIFDASEHGESVTYTPADDDIDPFIINVIFTSSTTIDMMETRIYHDVTECRIRQSSFDDQKLTGPVAQKLNQAGDTITRGSEGWMIIEPVENDPFCGDWKVTLEKSVKFSPA
jgi:hypothetical protein